MTKSRMLILGLLGLLVIIPVLMTGCLGTTSPDGGTSGGFDWTIVVFVVVIFGLMYLLMIRPQRKRQKEQQKMMSELQVGDEVMTVGGIFGTIDRIDEDSYVIKLESGGTMRIIKGAMAGKRTRS